MKRLVVALFIMNSFSVACASESKLKLDVSNISTEENEKNREMASSDHNVEEVERPESLRYDSLEYKKHKEYIRFIDRHYNR